ncbi:hypothetical protein DFQ28_009953 [Apophysomyces sp. BC1034]|nr:hypothetical protein DFQ28_009953 [Apophysomyces sp. BC1034]
MSDAEKKLKVALSRQFVDSGEKESRKLENITLDELIAETADYGRSTVNETIKKELLVQIKKFLEEHID